MSHGLKLGDGSQLGLASCLGTITLVPFVLPTCAVQENQFSAGKASNIRALPYDE